MHEDTISIEELRLAIGERVPPNGHAEDTLFTDEELEPWIDRWGDNLIELFAWAWRMKASQLAELCDMDENGSSRAMSQKYRHADRQAERFEKLANAEIGLTASTLRATPLGFEAFACEEEEWPLFTQGVDSVRPYPLFRMHVIK